MKRERKILLNVVILVIASCMAGVSYGEAMGTAFTYQGRLSDANSPAEGLYDFEFEVYDALDGGSQQGSTVSKDDVDVIDSYFTVPLDSGSDIFTGDARWLEIAVRPGASSDPCDFATLSPRQEITPVPYSLALPGLWTQQNATSTNLVGGYSGNTITVGVVGAAIGGGGKSTLPNKVTDDYSTVAGGANNKAGDDAGTTSDAICATVSGGLDNTASSGWATVGGGYTNNASGDTATISGGSSNTASGSGATISGGWFNNASYDYATVSGGYTNTASGNSATVGGGFENTASGAIATIPGGWDNTAGGGYSFAAGRQAKANHDGAFVWGDSTNADVTSTIVNQWKARASGGVYFYTNSTLTTGVYVSAGGNSWNSISDRATKENFTPVDRHAILQKLADLPVQEYNLKSQDESIRHIGPVAQDFATFGYGESDTAINMEDADGISFAAIQSLYELAQEKDAEIAAMKERLATMETAISKLIESNEGGQL